MAQRRFHGKAVFITGASSGIGASLAKVFAQEGASVVLAARRTEQLREIEKACASFGAQTLVVTCDVTRDGDLEAAVAQTQERFGKLDVVVANAGFGVTGRLDELSIDDFRRQFETNIFGLLRTVYASLPELKKNRGNLVLLGSVAGHVSLPEATPYAMSKFSVRALAEGLRFELAQEGVTVTLVSPGFVESEIRKVDNQGQMHPGARDPISRTLLVPSDTAAREIVNAVARGTGERIVTGHGKVIVLVNRFFPWLVTFLKTRGMKSRGQPSA